MSAGAASPGPGASPGAAPGFAVEGVPANAYWHPVTIEPGDIDEQGHVNNSVYVRWMDRAAVAHSAALGWGWADYGRIGAAFVVRRHEIDYLQSAVLEDREVLVATWPTNMAKATAERRHVLVRRADGAVLARAATRWAFVDVKTGRPTRIPRELADAFAAFSPGA